MPLLVLDDSHKTRHSGLYLCCSCIAEHEGDKKEVRPLKDLQQECQVKERAAVMLGRSGQAEKLVE